MGSRSNAHGPSKVRNKAEKQSINKDFLINHFSLWNSAILYRGYNDGTANQPFSIFNQLLGEYGLIGMLLFFYFYLKVLFNKAENAIGKFLIALLLSYCVLDYWFEYFSVIPIFELIFLTVSIKNDLPLILAKNQDELENTSMIQVKLVKL